MLIRYTVEQMNDSNNGLIGNDTDSLSRELLTVEQAAQYLPSIRSYIREGKLKAFRVAGLRKVLIAHSELLLLLEPTDSHSKS